MGTGIRVGLGLERRGMKGQRDGEIVAIILSITCMEPAENKLVKDTGKMRIHIILQNQSIYRKSNNLVGQPNSPHINYYNPTNHSNKSQSKVSKEGKEDFQRSGMAIADAVIKSLVMKSDLQNQSQLREIEETQAVNVYMRNAKKEARMVPLQSPAKSSDLTIIASTRFNIPEQRVVLFYNGFRIDNYSMPINLADRSIIHVLDRRNLGKPILNVLFKPISWNIPTFKLPLSPDLTIKEIMTSQLAPQFNMEENRFFIVYAGKTLNSSNTLREEYVEDESELIVIQHKSPKEVFQKEALEFNASYHLEDKYQSALKYNCPVTYVTNIDSLKKKNMQQAALIMQQNAGQPNAGPKPFPLPSFPVLNDSFLNNNAPFNINISTIKPEAAEIPEQPVAPLDKNSKKQSKQSSQVERCAPFPEEKSGEPKIKISKSSVEPGHEQKGKGKKQQKTILQLESNYAFASKEGGAAFPFPHLLSETKSEKDSFVDSKSAKPSPA